MSLTKGTNEMNGARRKEITAIINTLESIPTKIEKVLEDEQEYNDNIPENLQLSSQQEKSDFAIESLESAEFYLDIDTAIDSLRDAIG